MSTIETNRSWTNFRVDRRTIQLNRKSDLLNAASEDTQAAFADAVNLAAFFLTNSCTLSGRCPVNVSTSSDIRSNRPARCRSAIVARWFTR